MDIEQPNYSIIITPVADRLSGIVHPLETNAEDVNISSTVDDSDENRGVCRSQVGKMWGKGDEIEITICSQFH